MTGYRQRGDREVAPFPFVGDTMVQGIPDHLLASLVVEAFTL